MSEFYEKMQRQKKEDGIIYTQAVEKICATVDNSCAKHSQRGEELSQQKMAEEILTYFQLQPVEITPELAADGYLDAMLDVAHIRRRFVLLKGNWWKEDALPLLVEDKETEKTVLLLPGKWGGYYYYNEENGKKEKVTGKVAAVFSTEAYCLYPPFAQENFTGKTFLFAMLKAYRLSDWIMLLFVSMAVTAMGMVVPYVNQYIFNIVIPSGDGKDIFPMAALLFGVVITTAMFQLLRNIWVLRTGDRGNMWIESGIWNRIFCLPAEFYKKYESGDLAGRIFMLTDACKAVWESLLPALQTLLFSMMYLFQIHLMAGELLFTSCKILVCLLILQCIISYVRLKINRSQNEMNARLSGFLYQVYSGIRKIKLCGAEARVFGKWAEMYQKQCQSRFHLPFLVKYSKAILQLVVMAGTLLVYQKAYQTQMSVSDYISYQVAYGSLLGTVLTIGMVGEQLAFIRPAFDMASEILAQKEENSGRNKKVSHLEGRIELSNISFRYAPELDYVLNNFNLSIKKGEYVAITGASGCGKSTLFRLLLGFEHPETGMISFDDQDMESLDMQSVRRCIGTVLQNDKLFDGDIFSNISLCAPNITMEEAWDAAERAGVAEDIRDMPMGMFTMISENGGGISGGQKQRILIARVLAMKPDILLFDEATSALDNLTQAQVVRSLDKMQSTRIVIAHRLSTIQSCDRIIYLQEGKIAEEGTYEELLALDGGFAKLAKRQLA